MKIILLRRHKDIAKKTLFFEIEGALTHSSEHNHYPYDIKLDIKTESRSKHIYVSIRPYAVSFLRKMAHLFELVSFTTLP